MKSYRIVFKQSVLKDIRRIPLRALQRIRNAIDALRDNPQPHGCEKVRGYEHIYRIRIGRYRIVYEVKTTVRIITIIRVGHRKDVYKGM